MGLVVNDPQALEALALFERVRESGAVNITVHMGGIAIMAQGVKPAIATPEKAPGPLKTEAQEKAEAELAARERDRVLFGEG